MTSQTSPFMGHPSHAHLLSGSFCVGTAVGGNGDTWEPPTFVLEAGAELKGLQQLREKD